MTAASEFLIQKIETGLNQLKEVPLWGTLPPIDWKLLSEKLAKEFHLNTLHIEHKKTTWLDQSHLFSGFGNEPYILSLSLSPLAGQIQWLMRKEDMAKLAQYLLTQDHSSKGFSSSALNEGFYAYICLKTLTVIEELKLFPKLSLRLEDTIVMPQEGAFGVDIGITLNSHHLWGRLLCDANTLTAFKQHYLMEKPSLIKSALAHRLEVPLRLEVGSTHLSLQMWKKVKTGDCVLLDRCTLDPIHWKGSAELVFGNTPLFQIRIRQEEIKILEYAFYQEEQIPMAGKDQEEPFSEELEDTNDENEHLWSKEGQKDNLTEKLLSSKEIPLTLTVEIGRMTMSIDKLLQLQLGNVLELGIGPEHGVHLTISGKPIAKGELVKIGDVLGVKILKLG